MINFIKSRGLVFWLSLLAAIFIIIGLIVMLVSNGVNGYAMKNIGIFVVAAVVAILLLAAMEILAIKFGDRPWLIAFTAVIVALICLVLGFVLINRVDVASAVWTWDKGNARGEMAWNTAVISVVFYLLAAASITVSAFFRHPVKNVRQ